MQDVGPEDPRDESSNLRRRWERERSARLEAEAIAECSLSELYDKKEQLELLRAIVVTANESSCVEDVLQLSLTHICQTTGWSLGHAYMVRLEGEQALLVPTTIWHGVSTPSMRAFQEATEATNFDYGVGLPGRVLATGAPLWISHVSDDGNSPRLEAARLARIVAAFAFPVIVRNEVVAVLEFFSHREVAPNDFFSQLMAQIGTQLGRVVERKHTEDQLIYDASHDPLTKLPNRAFFLNRLTRAIALNKLRPEMTFAVLFIDLDRFKVINDSLGHHAGDELLIQVAARLSTSLPSEDLRKDFTAPLTSDSVTLARLGGDEFCMLLDELSDVSTVVEAANRIQEALGMPFHILGHDIYVSASIGIASSAAGYTSADEVLRDADLAMYRAKAQGKARYEIYDGSMHAMAFSRLEMETNLRKALQNNEFVLHYQPIVSLRSTEVVGFEALIRWRKADSELVYPDSFISIAEDTGLIVPIGMWVLREACQTMSGWQAAFPQECPLTISVNLSARQFAQANLVEAVRGIISDTGIDPKTVRLEITESATMGNAERTITVLSELRRLGVRFSIDDFGTGFSSLSYLHRFPLQVLKIDRSFISRMGQDQESLALVKTILNMARGLGMEVVAEGAETAAHITQLTSLECDFAQGYFYSKPLDRVDASKLLQAQLASQTSQQRSSKKRPTILSSRLPQAPASCFAQARSTLAGVPHR